MLSFFATIIYFIACHSGPADHFSAFAENLKQQGHQVHIYASGPAIRTFEENKIKIERQFDADSLSEELGNDIAQQTSYANVVFTDVGHPFDVILQTELAKQVPHVLRFAYYDNPEAYVPGGYSKIASCVMPLAHKVLFANANLARESIYWEEDNVVNLDYEKRVGIGYYPIGRAQYISGLRDQFHEIMRDKVFCDQGIKEKPGKLLVYFGSNNEEYYTKAFPAFLNILSEVIVHIDLSNFMFVLQQHPGAKSKNRDRLEFESWKAHHSQNPCAPMMVVSSYSMHDMQMAADGILYYQTSMAPLLLLSGIPLAQVGHKPYCDILVRNHLCHSITNSCEFSTTVLHMKNSPSYETYETMYQSLGIKEDWCRRLLAF